MKQITQASASVGVEQVEDALDIFRDVSPRARRRAQILGGIVEAATSLPSRGQLHISALRCAHHVRGSRCVGSLHLQCTEVPNRVTWRCDHCGDHGEVFDAIGSRWDLGGVPSGAVAIRLSHTEHRTMLSLDAMSRDALRAVAGSGRWVDDAIEITAHPATLRKLIVATTAEAAGAGAPVRAGRLRRLAEGLSEGLSASLSG